MKIYLAHFDPGHVGGGWTFQSNLAKAMPDYISNYDDASIYLIAGASMCDLEEVQRAKDDGKKIVLRCDNIPRNSRNRGTGMDRMKSFAEWSDLIVYQSNFCRDLLNPYLEAQNYTVIYNATDQSIFNPAGRTGSKHKYLYALSSDDETKNWEMARSAFQQLPGPKSLTIVGKPLASKISERNFDFFMGEKVEYIGEIQQSGNMAGVYKNHDTLLFSFFNDGCSNTLIEAVCCGMDIHDCYGMLSTGGSGEIMSIFKTVGAEFFSVPRMASDYKKALDKL
jgi:glycosyltransferase involved in cell wall biosynthesis